MPGKDSASVEKAFKVIIPGDPHPHWLTYDEARELYAKLGEALGSMLKQPEVGLPSAQTVSGNTANTALTADQLIEESLFEEAKRRNWVRVGKRAFFDKEYGVWRIRGHKWRKYVPLSALVEVAKVIRQGKDPKKAGFHHDKVAYTRRLIEMGLIEEPTKPAEAPPDFQRALKMKMSERVV